MTEAFDGVADALQRSTAQVLDVRGNGAGSCVVWGNARTAVTNAHVVRGRFALVRFYDGSRLEARVRERDQERDLALLEFGARTPGVACAVRASSSLRPGELVIAVGNPLGLAGALSTGIVLRRSARFVVADLCLLPGNSGGPLSDARGEVVGINSMVAGGLALAVPSEAVRSFLQAAGKVAA